METNKKVLVIEPSTKIYIKPQEINQIKRLGTISIGAYEIILINSRVTKK